MVWALSPLGFCPNPSQTSQTVCKLVTPSLPNVAFYPSSFQPLAHSLFSLGHKSIRQLLCHHIVPHSLPKTPGVGIPPQNSLLFSRVYALLPRSPAPTRSGPLVYPERILRRATSTKLCLPVSSLESALPRTLRKCGKQRTYKNANSFRIRTYKKHRGVGQLALSEVEGPAIVWEGLPARRGRHGPRRRKRIGVRHGVWISCREFGLHKAFFKKPCDARQQFFPGCRGLLFAARQSE
jgi:hypothetical protein